MPYPPLWSNIKSCIKVLQKEIAGIQPATRFLFFIKYYSPLDFAALSTCIVSL